MINLTADEKNGIALAAKEELARRSYADYFLLANSDINAKLYNYIEYICNRLQDIIDGKQKHLIISLPPQHGKSMCITETFASYYLMKYPENSVMVTSYAEDMYTRFARKERQHFVDWATSLFGLRIGKNSSNDFTVADHRGEAYFTSILGGGTGRPADLLIIDDPIKDDKEAASPTVRENIWNEWTSTFSTRLSATASVIVVMTRWSTDDLAGRLLDKMDFNWEEIKFPAIAHDIPSGQTDEIGRHNGEALNPEKHPLKQLLIQKSNLGTQKFNALYQQAPTIQDGNIIRREWIKFYVPDRETQLKLHLTDKEAIILPRHLHQTIQAWDATFKSKENDDFVAGQTWSRRDANVFLRPGWCHKRLSFTQTLDAIDYQSRLYPESTSKLVEDKANGPAIIDTLKKKVPGIMPVSPGSDSKEARFASVSPYFEAGQVYIPHPKWKPESQELIEEWCGFPNMPHDDQVDSATYAIKYLMRNKRRISLAFM